MGHGNSTPTIIDGNVRYTPPPSIDPRLKLLLVAVRRALLILADALKEYYDGA